MVFNLMAENTKKAEELLGSNLVKIMNQNRDMLVSYFNNKGILVVDNLNLLENDQYIDQNWTTEHYAEKGRKKIALEVAKELSKLYPKEFDIDVHNTIKTKYYNDGEKRSTWGQMQTITKERAFSGIRSSRVGDSLEFGLTCEIPYKLLPDSNKNEIEINFMVYQPVFNDFNAKIVIEAQGEEIEFFWRGINLNSQIKSSDEWKKFKLNFIIPDEIKKADIIKVYIHNPSKNEVYIDDMEVIFY
ncbi:unnamed protein product [marine sediment metagenome]|uniref:CBM-cenC domain-containing protein n=1 Tax=marine sediment metagenome TaxID=412755 RepID=X1AQF9_9ZZZZ